MKSHLTQILGVKYATLIFLILQFVVEVFCSQLAFKGYIPISDG